MSHRQRRILWLKDILEQLHKSQQQLQWAETPDIIRVLTEAMVRDLESCRKICEEMKDRAHMREAA